MKTIDRGWLCLLLLLVLLLSACGLEQIAPLPKETAVVTPSAEPAPTQEPEPTAEPTETPPSEEPEEPDLVIIPEYDVYLVSIEGTKYRSEPLANAEYVLGSFSVGTRLYGVEENGEYMLVQTDDGRQVWCNSWYLEAEDAELENQRVEAYLKARTETNSYVAMEGEPVYNVIASVLNCRSGPSTETTILYQIVTGTKVTVYGRDNNFYLCRLPNGKICYCSMDWLSDEATYVELAGAVDLRVFLSGAEFDLLFASSNNVAGHALYPAIPLLEEQTAFMLLEAYQVFQADGYTIKIYDAYRPLSAQVELYGIVQDSTFIADPAYGGSWHQRGRAVDISLVDLSTGKELEMPTPMHTFTLDAARVCSDRWTEEARENVDYMTRVMTEAGFGTINSEWWHFEYTGPGAYMDKELDYDSLWTRPVSDYVPRY